ncbi:GNAT family N-acetyltransferase [Paenibacillus sp. CAU 1782]
MMQNHLTITLTPVDQNNWYAVTQLETSEEQKSVFPVPAVYWLAESAYCGFTPLAMYMEDQLVGFVVHALDPDDGTCWIMAYMIDAGFQGKGLGRAGMLALTAHLRELDVSDRIRLGHRPANERAARLYSSVGFEEIGREGHEVIRELKL